ncbi:uncharacterized protein LOC121882433 isoform X1 [Thunnus maccoyii]|uniref:uncharacterized protein LOC121882433 isoform X1 n=1 Tax=Thunnus maccoyii TaxID=8240 RepID=UPI001C4B9799|nr:uncharacterized protein LOC121882433 isoform X1 [Thunnus maccoyii]
MSNTNPGKAKTPCMAKTTRRMAISKNGLTIFALLLALYILETGNFTEFSSLVSPVHYEEEHFLPHTRERRNVHTGQWNYMIDVEVNASDVETFERIRSVLNNTSLPIQLGNMTEISDIGITTVCSSTGTGFQCRCEEQFAWPYSSCITYGACDYISGGICKCINAIPADGQSCQPMSVLLAHIEYEVDVELNVTDVATVDYLRSLLNNGSFSLTLGPTVNVTHIDITTVCYPNGTSFQCRCEDQFVWSYKNCMTYGACDDITDDTCRCINAIPSDGQYCQPKTVPPVVYEYQIFIEVNTTDADQLRNTMENITFPIQISTQINISDANITTVCHQDDTGFQCRCEDNYLWPCDKCATYGKCEGDTNNTCGCIKAIPTDGQYCQSIQHQNKTVCPLTTTSTPPSTAPPVVYEYLISIELNTTDATVTDQLRTTLRNISFPISISSHIQVYDINISTVCYPSSAGFQCRCEDQYRWSCDQCILYGSCDNITDDTCGCINTLPPDGQYCQSADQHNFTACPSTTLSPPPTTPPLLYEYLISIELNTTDVATIDRLRTILGNITYPISINNRIQLSDVNISTVCYPSSGGFQCRCEDQYRWSCDQCFLYGSCDNITDDTCGCINTLPPDGQYCQPVDQHNFTACPLTTPSPPSTTPAAVYEYLLSIELNISDGAVIDQLRTILRNISYPISINNHIQIYDVNISTVCYPSSAGFRCRCEDQYRWSCDQCFLYGSCDNITDDTCGCINTLPPDGQYCQPVDQHNFTTCPLTTKPPPPTTAPVLYEYLISIELNTTDATIIVQLKAALGNISYPISINKDIEISDVNISTVCYPSSAGFQCRCEDQYRWSCDQCFLYGSCDNITDDTCGCINTLPPDGQYCQPVDQHNFTTCPATTPSPSPTTPPVVYEYIISVELNISDVAVIDQLRTILSNISFPISINNHIQVSDVNISTVCYPSSAGFQCRCEDQYRWSCDQCFLYGSCDNITDDTCGCINTLPPDGQYCQPVDQHNFAACPVTTPSPSPTTPPVYEYIISIELNISDVAVINQLRTILSNISYPISINNHIQVLDVNISTVCYPNGTTFQCRCEEQYRWPCHMCSTFGKCNNITDNTCGCINAIPPDGIYCQPLSDLFICPSPTPPTDSTPVGTTDVATTTVASTIITNTTPIATTDLNTTTPTITPSTVVTNSTPVGTTNLNTTAAATTSLTVITNSTPVATTHMNTTTLTTSPTTVFNDSTTVATTNVSTTTVTPTPTTSVTNSTPVATTHMNTTTLTTSPTTVFNDSTTVATTNVSTTTVTPTPTTSVTNSTPVATTHMNTTIAATPTTFITYSTPVPTPDETSTTAATPTSAVTDLTPHETTHQNTTSHTSAPVTEVTNSTLIATTTTTRPTTVITNSTTIATTPTTIVTNSTPAVTTTTTQPTTIITTTHVTSQNTTVSSTSEVTSTPALTTTTSTKASATTTTVPNMTTTMTITTTTTSTTATSTPSATSLTTTASTTVTTPPASTTASATGFDVEMLIRLDKQYTPELNDATSSTYKELESRIDSVLEEQYKGITGFINVFVRAFREGSLITDFVVQTRQINSDEIAKANQKLPEAMEPIAPVIGSVTALYNSPTSISFPNLTYTGKAMTLTCGPPPENINIGQISDSRWKFRGLRIKGSGRFTITTSDNTSVLRIDNVILADAGLYECTLIGRVMDFLQKGDVTKIKQAPVVRLQSKVNVQCKLGQIQPLQCCVQSDYKVKWFQGTTVLQSDESNDRKAYCITHDYQIDSCSESEEKKEFICRVDDPKDYSMTTTMIIFRGDVKCDDAQYGKGRDGDRSSIRCDEGQEGSKTAVCKEGAWTLEEDSCILTDIKELLIDSQDLVVAQVPNFVANLSKAVQEDKTEIANSSATISAIVDILNTIANVSAAVNESIMEDVLKTVDVIIADDAKQSWEVLNANKTQNASSELLGSLETLSENLAGEFRIVTQRIQLNRTMFNKNYDANPNSSVGIGITNTNTDNVFITTITFSTLNNVMPARNSSFDTSLNNATNNNATNSILANTINAAVVLVKTNASIQNVTFRFNKRNNSLTQNPQCVFWNFTLLDNLGAWDDEGCTFVSDENNRVICSCNHLTSFSILMATNIPQSIREALDIITYVGVGISMASLVICLIIEGYVWKAITRNSTAFMRHVSIVNTALSLLIANICFIIGAAIANNPLENPGEDHKVPVGPCSTATFFMHFFYLALFFWMLASGLLLFYRTVMVFSHMSKSTMLAIGFSLGYGCPLIIAVITVAVTAPVNGYIRKDNACWLNWKETKALLALVIPALTIVLMNILIVIVVLFKMLRRGVGDTAQSDEKHTLVVIARCVIILTPLFGLTWSLGVGTMISPENKGIHIAFAFFNSLQGFFILVFGTLLDSKIRSILSRQSPTSSITSNPTRSTSGIPSSGGIPSFSGTNLISRLRGRRYIYHVSEAANHSNSTDLSESFVSI